MTTLLEKARSLSAAMITHAADGLKPADAETVQQRLSICSACSKYDPGTYSCDVCGCFMPLKAYIRGIECAAKPPKWGKAAKPETQKTGP